MQITINVDVHELSSLKAALLDYRSNWLTMVRDCQEGLRPNMDVVGATMILEETESLIDKVTQAATVGYESDPNL